MTIEDLASTESAILLAVTTAGVEAIKRAMPPHVAKAAWFRRCLPFVAGIVGAALASTGLLWPDAEVRHRIIAGALVGLLGPAVSGVVKRRVPPKVA